MARVTGKGVGTGRSGSAAGQAPAARAGDVREGLEAIARGQATLVRVLTRRLGSRADAEDFVQTALLRALTRAGELRDGTKVLPWFRRILETGLADHGRRRAAESRMRVRLARDAAPDGQAETDVQWLSCQCLETALAAVKTEYADIVRRVDLEEISLRQVALDLGIRPNSAAVRLHRGRRAVIRALRQLCRFCRLHWRFDYCGCPRPANRPRRSGAGEGQKRGRARRGAAAADDAARSASKPASKAEGRMSWNG